MSTRRTRPRKASAGKRFLMSRTQRLWVVGLFLAALALTLVIRLIQTGLEGRSSPLLDSLRTGLGLGVYVMPLAVAALSAWCLVLATGHICRPPWIRIVGILLTLIACLALAQHLGPASPGRTAPLRRGGMLGYWVSSALSTVVGQAGTVIVLVAVGLFGMKVAFDISIAAALGSLARPIGSLRDLARRLRPNHAPKIPLPTPTPTRPKPSPRPRPLPHQPATQPAVDPGSEPARKTPVESETRPEQPWVLPALDSVFASHSEPVVDVSDIRHKSRAIEQTLASLGLPCRVIEVNPGPTVTQFGIEPGYVERRDRQGNARRSKVRVSRIQALANDLALALAAPSIRIEAPIPGKSLVGIEVPNAQSVQVTLREIMETDVFAAIASAPLAIALGRNVSGDPVSVDLADLPHLLIAGATGAGKSVCLNAIIACLLCRNTPETLRLILVDPKRVELSGYNGIPHLLSRVVVDTGRVVGLLRWLLREMDRRYGLLAAEGARNLGAYNAILASEGEALLPNIVCILDELADLMMGASDDLERLLCRLAQMARATGIHLIIATQRPSVDILTGLIKANFPARLAFAVSSSIDSRVILDTPGAERLLGRGDALYMSPDSPNLERIQGCHVSDAEISRLVAHWRRQAPPSPSHLIVPEEDDKLVQKSLWPGVDAAHQKKAEEDELLEKATALVREQGRASASLLQRSLRIGYTRAARLIDRMEQLGIVGPAQPGNQPREVLDPTEESSAPTEAGLHSQG